CVFFFSSRRRHTRFSRDWSSDVCSSDLNTFEPERKDGGSAAGAQALVRHEQFVDRAATVAPRVDRAAGRCAAHLVATVAVKRGRSEEHTSELQSRENLVCRLLLEKKKAW